MPLPSPTNPDWRILAAQEPPRWNGDLDDDCTGFWAGFTLRAEMMDEDYWWWCVYDYEGDDQIASSNDDGAQCCTTGEAARAAEQAARRLLGLGPEKSEP